jgi:hypothetical protein
VEPLPDIGEDAAGIFLLSLSSTLAILRGAAWRIDQAFDYCVGNFYEIWSAAGYSKLGRLRSSRRAAAIALLKVGRGFRYQLAARWVGAAPVQFM